MRTARIAAVVALALASMPADAQSQDTFAKNYRYALGLGVYVGTVKYYRNHCDRSFEHYPAMAEYMRKLDAAPGTIGLPEPIGTPADMIVQLHARMAPKSGSNRTQCEGMLKLLLSFPLFFEH